MGRFEQLQEMLRQKRFGFRLDEVMTGTHRFEPGYGEPGDRFMEYRVTWGPRNVGEFLNPLGGKFMYNDLEGFVDIEGLCRNTPVLGSLELHYFTEAKIRYSFTFEVNGTDYQYIGEKIDLRPWNLHRTHTTCHGTLFIESTGEIVSRSVTHFRWHTLPGFLASIRLG
ncbi:MAG TPA: hypothetical protein PKW95_05090 [bacterium]|nr:hypothetical protein [bacterium]